MSRHSYIAGIAAAIGAACAGCGIQQYSSHDDSVVDDGLTLEAVYRDKAFEPEEVGLIRWLKDGSGYTVLEKSATTGGQADRDGSRPAMDLVFYDPRTLQRRVLVASGKLILPGVAEPLVVEDYAWSDNQRQLLIYTNGMKVWRSKSRGDYWLLDMASGKLRQLGGGQRAASSLMFAKFSPDSTRVAYVSENNIFVEAVDGSGIIQLTRDGSDVVINGTLDWAYEEEFMIRDGFRWSPDSRRIAFWQLDASRVREFILVNNTDELYPTLRKYRYPKVGEAISAARIGIVSAQGGEVVWAALPGDPSAMYIPRMDWADNSRQVLIQHVNRKQDTVDVYYASAEDGRVTPVLQEKETTFIHSFVDPIWVDQGDSFLWISERNDWRHVLKVSRNGRDITDITPGAFDITELLGVDAESGWAYFIASPHAPEQRYLYRSRLDGSGQIERVTPEGFRGTNSYRISDDGRWAVHTHSSFSHPPSVRIVNLPDHRDCKVLVDNHTLVDKLSNIRLGKHEFFSVKARDGVVLRGYIMRPADFSPAQSYPIVMYAYGEPWGTTVLDGWDGKRFLFMQLLLRQGFLVASVDNRGTAAPKGRAWRKSIYGAVGTVSALDQSDALHAMMARWSYIDPDRVGIWGFSGGGSMVLNLMFRYPQQYQVGIAGASVPDQRLYDAIYQERYSGLLQDYAAAYTENSPITHASRLEGKLLLIHGTGDDNVHYQGIERLINELVKHNKPFDLMAYPNRSHRLDEGEGTVLHMHSLMLSYFTEHLRPGSTRDQSR